MDELLTIKDLQEIFSDIFDKAGRWYHLGLALGLVSDELDKIKVNHREKPNDCLLEMLKIWLLKNSPEPTRKALISALRERTVGETSFADHLERKYTELPRDRQLEFEKGAETSSNKPGPPLAPPPCLSPSSFKGLEVTRQNHLSTTTVDHDSNLSKRSSESFRTPNPKQKCTEFYNGMSYEFVSLLPEDLLCQQCHHLAFEPQQMKCCGKLYCQSCMTSGQCVKCRKPGESSMDVRSNNQIKDLTIRCANSKDGCSWEGRLGDVAGHRSCCHKEMVLCIYKDIGCSEVMHRDEVKEHEEEKWRVHLDYSLKKQMSMMNRIEQLEQQQNGQERRLQLLQKGAFPSPPNLTVTMTRRIGPNFQSGVGIHWVSRAFFHQGYLLQLVLKCVLSTEKQWPPKQFFFFTLVGSDFEKNVTWPCSGNCHLKGRAEMIIKFTIKKTIGPLDSLCDISPSDRDDLVWNEVADHDSRIITPITENPKNPFQLSIMNVELDNVNTK